MRRLDRTRDSPFLTCGNKTSKSCIKCLMRPVTPREDTISTLSLRLFSTAFEVDAEAEPFTLTSTSSAISASEALPLPLFLDACLRIEAIFRALRDGVCMTESRVVSWVDWKFSNPLRGGGGEGGCVTWHFYILYPPRLAVYARVAVAIILHTESLCMWIML